MMASKDRCETDELIDRLVEDADRTRSPYRALLPRLMLAVGVSLVLSITLVSMLFGVRPDLTSHAWSFAFLFKVLAMGLAAMSGVLMVRSAGIPGSVVSVAGMMLLLAMVMASGVLLDESNLPLSGARAESVVVCVSAIVLAALPGLIVLLATLRSAIPTRPTLAGAAAGVLAGAIGALGYTISCINDGALFVSVWYSIAILLSAVVGAVVGSRILAW